MSRNDLLSRVVLPVGLVLWAVAWALLLYVLWE
jgi:hypothetical protein